MDDKRRAGPTLGPRRETRSRDVIPLFRREGVDARREKALGEVLLVQPLPTRLLTLVAVILASALVAFAFWGEYTRKAHVTGYLVPTAGLIKLYPRETGTIVEKRVVEGQKVAKGDVLFVVSMERRSTGSVDTQAAAMEQLENRRSSLSAELEQHGSVADIEDRELRQRIASMTSELGKLNLELDTQRQRVEVAEGSLARYRDMFTQSLASVEMVEQRRRDLLEQQGKLFELERNRIGLSGQIESL